MQWASVSANDNDLDSAVTNAADRLTAQLGSEPHLIMVFIAGHHRAQFSSVPALMRRHFETATLFGCLCDNSIGEGREYEDQSTITLMGAVLPDVRLQPSHLDEGHFPPTYAERSLWDAALGITEAPECLLLLGAPLSIDNEDFLKGLDRQYPSAGKIGGLASGIAQQDTPCLLINDSIYSSGVAVLAMSGDIALDSIVAQGCRPIGDPMFANSTHENLLIELDGKIPREVLTDVYGKLNRHDRQLFTQALFLGIAMDTHREEFRPGDFLVRAILGLDPQSGALWINSPVAVNSVVQLHVRDAASAARDVEQSLQRYRSSPNSRNASGALLLSCTGRGTNLYEQPNHDTDAFLLSLGDIPLSGFFCDGEIGPVRGNTYLHTFTSVFGVFRSKQKRETH